MTDETNQSARCTLKTAYTIYIENVKTLEIGKDIRGIMCESMWCYQTREIIERLLNQLLLKQRTQKPVINAMMAADYAESNLTNPKDEFSARRFANLSERKRELSWAKIQIGQALRAQGGCLGTESRRKTWQAAKSCGEEQISIISADIRMRELN